jgi:hypothetical protein
MSRPSTSSRKANLDCQVESHEASNKGELLQIIGEQLSKDSEAAINRAHETYKRLSTAFREVLWNYVAAGCLIAVFLEADEDAWSAFCSNRIWDGRKARPNSQKPDQALRFVLLRISGLSKEGAKRASKWYKAVQPLVAGGVEPEDIYAAIKKGGGIEALARRNAQPRKSKLRAAAGVNKLLAANKNTKGNSIRHEPATKSPTFVDLRAKLVEEGEMFLSLRKGALAQLTILMQPSEGFNYDISILDVTRVKPPLF